MTSTKAAHQPHPCAGWSKRAHEVFEQIAIGNDLAGHHPRPGLGAPDPEPLARAYTNDAAVIALTAALIPIAGVFQIFDGIQAVSAGVLRGIGEALRAIGIVITYLVLVSAFSVLSFLSSCLAIRAYRFAKWFAIANAPRTFLFGCALIDALPRMR